jgi:hypothetical protein
MDSKSDRPKTIAANEAMYVHTFAEISKGTLNFGAERIKTKNTNEEIWLASIDIGDGNDLAVYLRISGRRQMMAELLCSIFGRALGLPIPQPFFVTVDKKKLNGSKLLKTINPTSKPCVMFASASITGAGNFAQLLDSQSAYAKKLLQGWAEYPTAGVFDEICANSDRNFSNIIFQANILWLIDHADALGGAQAELFPMEEFASTAFTNILIDRFQADFSQDQRISILKIAQEVINQTKKIDIHEMVASIGEEYISADGGIAEVVNFLTQRILHTMPLLRRRLGFPELSLNLELPCHLKQHQTPSASVAPLASAP